MLRSILYAIIICITFAYQAYSIDVIYIYNDEGVSKESLDQTIASFKEWNINGTYEIRTIDAATLLTGDWALDAKLFVLPGGADLPYLKKLKGTGDNVIKDYVSNGGSFLGICAGSYYASSYVEFDKGGQLEVLGNRDLRFFKGSAVGPILAKYDYKTNSGARAAIIKTNLPNLGYLKTYYNGGGYFRNANDHTNVDLIAVYENNLPAIILIKNGNGNVLLSGVHFEYNSNSLDKSDIHLSKIKRELSQWDSQRKALFSSLMQKLGLHP
jgi:glutamine amidotransferase-like uncharacterized protein